MMLWLVVFLLLQSVPAAAQTAQSYIDHALADLAAAKALLGPPVINVAPSQNLQTLLDNVQPGTILQLEPGASYGPTTIRRSVTIQPRGFVPGQTPHVRFVANGLYAIAIESGDVTLIGVELTGYANDVLLIKQTAGNTTVRHAYIHGDPVRGAKRGIQANGRGLTLEDSVITDIFRVGQESAGIGAWDTPGPFTIRRNVIQAAAINFLFGGADPSSPANIPSDILIEDNTFNKKLEWRSQDYGAKSLGELKNARRATIRRNLFQDPWAQGQTAYGLVLAVRNQDGGCPYCIVEDVLIRRQHHQGRRHGRVHPGTRHELPVTDDAEYHVSREHGGQPESGAVGWTRNRLRDPARARGSDDRRHAGHQLAAHHS